MNTYRIITDSSCDMTQEMADALELDVVPLTVNYKGKEYPNYLDGRELNIGTFYESLRAGEMATTSAVNPTAWKAAAEKAMQAGQDVLILAFSSGLSTTFSAAVMASQELLEEYPDRKIYVVDTLCACCGVAALIEPVVKMREAGCSIEDARDWLEENKRRVCHWISVDDLGHLYRGGRLSAAGAVVGTALGIKPIIDLNSEGKLITQEKVRGKNNVYAALARHLEDADNLDVIYITHAGAPEEAKKLAETIKKNYKVGEIRYSSIGPVVGCHTGPGTIAVVFFGTRSDAK